MEICPISRLIPRPLRWLWRLRLPVGKLAILDGDPGQILELDEALTRTPCQLVVIDPIMAFLDAGVSSANDQSVRRALTPLSNLAERHRCLILMIRHPNKSGGSMSLYRGAGSIGIVGACRSALVTAPDPQNPNHHVLAHVKNNLGPLQPSLAYRISGDDKRQKLDWLGKSPWSADQLLAAVNRQVLTPRELARNFLLDFLADAPRLASDVLASAHNLGLADRTLNRAKRDLKIRSVRIYVDEHPIYYWLLPEQALPDNVPPDSVPPSLEPWLKLIRERYSGRGPSVA